MKPHQTAHLMILRKHLCPLKSVGETFIKTLGYVSVGVGLRPASAFVGLGTLNVSPASLNDPVGHVLVLRTTTVKALLLSVQPASNSIQYMYLRYNWRFILLLSIIIDKNVEIACKELSYNRQMTL